MKKPKKLATLSWKLSHAHSDKGREEILKFGRELSDLERAAEEYSFWRNELMSCFDDLGRVKADGVKMTERVHHRESKRLLAETIMRILDARNARALREVARRIEGHPQDIIQEEARDQTRWRILMEKSTANGFIEAKDLAKRIGFAGDVRGLRRIASELGFKFKKGKPGRPRKSGYKRTGGKRDES